MDAILDILKSLGIDHTLFFQFGVFFVAFLAMNFIVFKPYLRAYEKRLDRTHGNRKQAQSLLEQAEKKQSQYREAARKLNSAMVSIFTDSNKKAKKEAEKILLEAKKELESQEQSLRKQMEKSVVQSRKEMEDQLPEIRSEIQKKFMEPQGKCQA